MSSLNLIEKEIRHGHVFCGIGGGALGFNRGQARVGHMVGKFRCVGGIDSDPAACRDFQRHVQARATCRDLFTLEQFCEFHGRMPPPGWVEAQPEDVANSFDARPNIIFLSAPCKGFSGLLSETASQAPKYQALNGLTLHGIDLVLRAFADDPVELFAFENVPRIASRGRPLLDEIMARFRRSNYAAVESLHDCGELGWLAQSRKRFLLVARHRDKVPPFLHEPIKHPLRGVGEVLEKLPLPLSGLGGPMHRMPALQWQTWVRLAFVRAGEDWRSLNELAVENGVLRDFGIMPARGFRDAYGVRSWEQPAALVTSNCRVGSGPHNVADPRPGNLASAERACYGVGGFDQPAAVVTSARSPGQGRNAVADPRVSDKRNGALGVLDFGDAAGAVQGESLPTNGSFAVADPRPPEGENHGKYRVTRDDEAAGAVISASTTGTGAFAVADVRIEGHAKSVQMGVRTWENSAPVVRGNMAPGAGPNSVADPRLRNGARFNNVYRIVRWGDHAVAIAGPGGTGPAVADPRPGVTWAASVLGVNDWGDSTGVVTGRGAPGGGANSVADPRFNWHEGASSSKVRVTAWKGNARPITGAQQVASGAGAVADPRPGFIRNGADRENYQTGGHYGVVRFDRPTPRAVTGAGQHDNGFNSVADPRSPSNEIEESYAADNLPALKERMVCVIVARDGTWHRPFTTLELAALQGLVDPAEQFELDGLSDAAWRERIGNCVPPPSAQAIASVMGETLLLAWAGETFKLSTQPIWVRNIAVSLSVDLKNQFPGGDLCHEA